MNFRADPVVGPYYEWFVIFGGLALALVALMLLYQVARYTAKAVSLVVRFTIWAAVGVLLLIAAIFLALVVLPWAGRVTGANEVWPISHIYEGLAERYYNNNHNHRPQSGTNRGNVFTHPCDDSSDCVEIEIDPDTGQRVRLPRLGNRIHQEHWERVSKGVAKTFLGSEGLQWLSAWLKGDWGTWGKLSFVGKIAAHTTLSLLETAAQGVKHTVAWAFSNDAAVEEAFANGFAPP